MEREEMDADQGEGAKHEEWTTPKISDMPRGTRIYGEGRQGPIDQVKGTFTEQETVIYLEILYNREVAFAWDFEECGRLDPKVAPP